MVIEIINKHIYLLFILFSLKGQSQPISTEYFIGLWEPADNHKYDIKRLVMQTDSGYQIKDYRKNEKLKFEGLFSSINPVVEHGHFSFYGKKGKLEAEGNYVNGVLTGTWNFYNEDGSLKKEVDYSFPQRVCEPLDKAERELILNSIDSIRTESVPVYPGTNTNAMYQFIYEHLVYPPLASMYFKSGKVVVKFKIDVQGDVCNVYAEAGMDKDLELETRRVISLLSKWTPGMVNGIPVMVEMTCPITFSFQ